MGFLTVQDSPRRRAMVFVDGSNVLTEMGTQLGIDLRSERPTQDQLRLACLSVEEAVHGLMRNGGVGPHLIARRYWFGSVQGSEEDLDIRREQLRQSAFDGVLFRKVKGRKEKGVDLAIAREMLIHGFNKNYDLAVLAAGDEDYLGLVGDLKRLGVTVAVAYYESPALSGRLRVSADVFMPINSPSVVHPDIARLVQSAA